MIQHEKLNYVEFPSRSLQKTKAFFETAFGWSFEDYGSDILLFLVKGWTVVSSRPTCIRQLKRALAYLVFYSSNLEATLEKVTKSGGKMVKPIFSFPGGRRFHFI